DRPPAIVDEIRATLDCSNLLAPDHAMRGGSFRHMQRHNVALCQQITQVRGRLGVAMTKLVRVIVDDDPHFQRFREIRELRADIAVATDAERLAPYLLAVVC